VAGRHWKGLGSGSSCPAPVSSLASPVACPPPWNQVVSLYRNHRFADLATSSGQPCAARAAPEEAVEESEEDGDVSLRKL
jgi:hypothetical protein